MPKYRDYHLSEEALAIVEEAISHSKQAEVIKRAMALRLLHQGQTPQQVADTLLVNLATIYNWCDRWEATGIAGLVNLPKSGRPAKADEGYRQALAACLEQNPTDYGYAFNIWTLDRLRQHLAQTTGISLSRGRFQALMSEMGYVYRRPQTDLRPKQDQAAKEQAQAIVTGLKKAPNKGQLNSSLWTKPV